MGGGGNPGLGPAGSGGGLGSGTLDSPPCGSCFPSSAASFSLISSSCNMRQGSQHKRQVQNAQWSTHSDTRCTPQ
jgi:hypothetical protein